jgi:hypothetical protein
VHSIWIWRVLSLVGPGRRATNRDWSMHHARATGRGGRAAAASLRIDDSLAGYHRTLS